MNCTEARRNWMLYLDSEGDPELHLGIRDHIAACPGCATWFCKQEQLERRISDQLSAGDASPDLWKRVLTNAGLQGPAPRKYWPAMIGALAAVAVVLLAVLMAWQRSRTSLATELAQSAAEWYQAWQRGNLHPDLVSASDLEVDRYLKAKAPFHVHCPPRTDVHFMVQGAGLCQMKDHRQAAYVVGHVGEAPVSILVLDRAGLATFPGDGFYHCRAGACQVASGVVKDSVVVIVGDTTAEVLERLLRAYGTYPD